MNPCGKSHGISRNIHILIPNPNFSLSSYILHRTNLSYTTFLYSSENTELHIKIQSFDFGKKRADVNIDINYICTNRSNLKIVFFILQVPYYAKDLKVAYSALSLESFGGKSIIKSINQNFSFIIIQIPKENVTFGKNEYMSLSFSIENIFWRYRRKISYYFVL